MTQREISAEAGLAKPRHHGQTSSQMGEAMRRVAGLLLMTLAAGLAGCQSLGLGSATPPAAPAPDVSEAAPAPYSVERLIGAWGVASYRDEKDRVRTEAQARAQCRNPYVIKRGPTDGVLMHVADDSTPHELALKKGADGKVYLGFAGPAGDTQDRLILSISEREFITRYVDPDTNTRYGTFVYVRCAKV
jgi:hypothetical protein